MGIEQNMVRISARKIAEAQRLANDSRACAAKARELYGRYNTGGKWKRVQSEAAKLLANAAQDGLTVEKPVKVIDGRTYGFFSGSYPVFLF